MVELMIKVNYGYQFDEDEEKPEKISKMAVFNAAIGIPIIGLLIYFLIKGFFAGMIAFAYVSLSVLVFGVGYSVFKIIKTKFFNR
jgi:hypothetical protein